MQDEAMINWRKCEICGEEIPDDCRLCDRCIVDVMLYAEIRNELPS